MGGHPSAREAGLWAPSRAEGRIHARHRAAERAAPPADECARRAEDGTRAPSHASGRTAGALAHGVDGPQKGTARGHPSRPRTNPRHPRANGLPAPSLAGGRIPAQHRAAERATPPAGECARRAEDGSRAPSRADGLRALSRADGPRAPSRAGERMFPGTQPPSAPPHRPVSAPAAPGRITRTLPRRRTHCGRPPARADGSRSGASRCVSRPTGCRARRPRSRPACEPVVHVVFGCVPRRRSTSDGAH